MDCMELMERMSDGSVSMILTDPPYGISYQNKFTTRKYPVLEGDGGIDYRRFAAESYRILKEDAHAYVFTRFDCYPYHYQCLSEAGFTVKNCLVVEKAKRGRHRRPDGQLCEQCGVGDLLPERQAGIPPYHADGE